MPHYSNIEKRKQIASNWFQTLRDKLCIEFAAIEAEYSQSTEFNNPQFIRKQWSRDGGGGGEMSIMRGQVFEKVGVNISTVYGELSNVFAKEIPGTKNSQQFWASGISLVAHMHSPFVPAVHMNTRLIVTEESWFGGGADMTPVFDVAADTKMFHQALKNACDKIDLAYYPKFKKQCDEYFYLPHRKETRGVGGIFYDYLNTGNWDKDFKFTRLVGSALCEVYPKIVRKYMLKQWSPAEKEQQLIKRGRYAEFNLLYDRGTKFGLMTDGNIEAIFMSMPPQANW